MIRFIIYLVFFNQQENLLSSFSIILCIFNYYPSYIVSSIANSCRCLTCLICILAPIGAEAARHRYSVYFITCQELMSQLKKAEMENRLEARLKAFMRHKLLIIDEIGYLNLDQEDANLFFQLISLRYEKKSTIITTNKTLSKWTEIFGDPIIVNAILDRLLHHSHIINIVGPSYKTKNILTKAEEPKNKEY
ncbi:MAG: ATP-binding protein [Kandleria vitulina]|uniref:ATP-binding protein n=1 Tax=Kandleria vitulina TaxID=1630 RepID=UPI002E7A460B|nr:ATP-binding protein [Kandleria vitulina]MEE0988639.1 ATP-binding protein [Kandleria vitulina]